MTARRPTASSLPAATSRSPAPRRRAAPRRPTAPRRRELLLAAAGALLVRPARAVAADRDPELLLELAAREDAAALAYERAAPEPLAGIAAQEADHAAALRTMLDAFGRKAPPAALDAPARRLAEAPGDGKLDAAIALEASLIEDYQAALLDFEEEGVLQSAASIMASHAQHHARLRSQAGLDPFG
jgi:Ferritin-like domain